MQVNEPVAAALKDPGVQGTGVSPLQSWPAGQAVQDITPSGEYSLLAQFEAEVVVHDFSLGHGLHEV